MWSRGAAGYLRPAAARASENRPGRRDAGRGELMDRAGHDPRAPLFPGRSAMQSPAAAARRGSAAQPSEAAPPGDAERSADTAQPADMAGQGSTAREGTARGEAAPAGAESAGPGPAGAESSGPESSGPGPAGTRPGLRGLTTHPAARQLTLLICYLAAGVAATWPRATYLAGQLPYMRDSAAYVWGFWWMARRGFSSGTTR